MYYDNEVKIGISHFIISRYRLKENTNTKYFIAKSSTASQDILTESIVSIPIFQRVMIASLTR